MRVLLIALLALFVTDSAAGIDVYHVGNSLTQDVVPRGVQAIAEQRGHDHNTGKHIRSGRSLDYIWNNPDETTLSSIAPYGRFTPALSGHTWDAIVLQPYPNAGTTLKQDADRILDFIALSLPSSPGATFYIHSAWPTRGTYADKWTAPSSNTDGTPAALSRAYHTNLLDRVRSLTDASVYFIPVGEVLYELDRKLKNGELPGYNSAYPLYRDTHHLTHDLGRYVAGVTTYSTLYGEDPSGLAKPSGFYASAASFNAPFYDLVHSTAWDVVTNNSEVTGVPEPGTCGLLLAGLAWSLRRRTTPQTQTPR